ncbi:MAG: DNA repair protein RadC [Methylococcales bacterium]
MSKIIKRALKILESRMTYEANIFSSPDDTKNYLRLKLGNKEREIFSVLYLSSQHQLISYEELFLGTIDGASIHVREIVKLGLSLNAAAIVCAHNHPSGICEPSKADELITQRIKDACELVDIRMLDHLIVSATGSVSLAERGLI